MVLRNTAILLALTLALAACNNPNRFGRAARAPVAPVARAAQVELMPRRSARRPTRTRPLFPADAGGPGVLCR